MSTLIQEAIVVPTTVSVQSAAPNFLEQIAAGRHVLLGDEPLEAGGQDGGPNPYEFLLAALGCCKAITLRMYAERKGWALQKVHVSLSHAKVPAEDAVNGAGEPRLIDRIEIEIGLSGELAEDQRQTLLAMAEKCPVHRTLTSSAQILTRARACE
jgi:putative redox protein